MKAGQWPALPECGGGVLIGGDTGQFESATAGRPSTRDVSLDGTGCCWCGWRECIAPCWVLKEQPVAAVAAVVFQRQA